MANEYTVKSLQRYAEAQEFSWDDKFMGLKTGQWLIQHWFHKKIIFMTHGNDLLQMHQILCAASINYHMWIFINFLSYVFCVKINKE